MPLCVVVLGSNSWGLPTKSNSLIVKRVCVFLWDHVHAGDYICTRAGVCVSVCMCVFAREIEFVCQTTNYCTNVLRADPGKRVN